MSCMRASSLETRFSTALAVRSEECTEDSMRRLFAGVIRALSQCRWVREAEIQSRALAAQICCLSAQSRWAAWSGLAGRLEWVTDPAHPE